VEFTDKIILKIDKNKSYRFSISDLIAYMKKSIIIAFLFIIISISALASEGVLLFKPYTAGIFEPRIGSVINLSQDNLRLDIGASFDLSRINLNTDSELSIGGDFFTYTRLRSETNFKFPVETSDYYFGINSAVKFRLFENNFSSRLRIAHISSHLVDGYSKDGIFFKQPFVYSREFVDWSLAFNKQTNLIDYRIYAGATFVFATTPDSLNQFIPYLGIDFNRKIIDNIEFSGGMELRKGEFDKLNVSAQLGLNFKFFKDFGIFLGYYKYNGSSIHGMFYDKIDNYDGIGFQIIYF
jgi:hypothetical protein